MIFSKTVLAFPALIALAATAFAQVHAPTPPPNLENPQPARLSASVAAASGPYLFSIGDPTDEETMYLELINRARTNAVAESFRLLALTDPGVLTQLSLYNVNLQMVVDQFATNPPVAPLSFNAKLNVAARAHSQYQFDNGIQSHDGPGTDTLVDRLNRVGYLYSGGNENVFSRADNVEHGHAGFEIDWGPGPGGIQTPPGHRNAIHNGQFTEVGIGVVKGTNQVGAEDPVGPQVVTQDFGRPATLTNYVTGVAYFDLNGNQFYDLGEGVGGVTVTVDGENAFAVTSHSGAYSVPVAKNKTHTIRFNLAGRAEHAVTKAVAAANVKLDFAPAYVSAAVVDGPSVAFTGAANLYQAASLPGATAYRERTYALQPVPFEGAEDGTANVTLTTFGAYTVFSDTSASGAKSFRLAHVTDPDPVDPRFGTAYPQLIEFKSPLFVKAGAKVDFKSRLGIALAGETARLEVSTDNGATWISIWSQAGTTIPGGVDDSEKAFSAKSASLAGFAGGLVRVRFNFDVNPLVGWFSPGDGRFGWYVDDIAITNAELAVNPTIVTVGANAHFQFTPPAPGNYLLQFQPVVGARELLWGPIHAVTAQADPPSYVLQKNVAVASGTVTLRFTKASGTATPVLLESAPNPAGPWARVAGATVTGPANGEYEATASAEGSARFYRLVAD